MWAAPVTLSIGDYAGSQDPVWANGTAHSSIIINSDLTVTSVEGGNNGKYYTSNASWRHYENNNGAVTITTTNGTINSISFVYESGSNGVLKYGDIDVASGALCTAVVGQTSATFNVSHSSGTNGGNVQIKSITVDYTGAAASCATPTFSLAEGVYTTAQNVTINCVTNGATIYYTTDGTIPTTSSNVYSSAININESKIIKAIAVKTGNNNSIVASASYAILGHTGTEADPYSVADAREAIDFKVGVNEVYATGVVSEIVTAYNSNYGNISFNISADGQTTGDQLQAYRCKGTTGVNAEDVRVGDVVLVKGNLTKHNSTYEFNLDCELVSMVHATYPYINANNVTLEFDATSGEIPYTIDNPTSATLSAAVTEGNWISNIGYANGKVTFSASQNTGESRTATITLSYTGATDKIVTVTQKEVGYATLPFSFDGGKGEIDQTFGLTQSGLGSNYTSSPKLKFDNSDDCLILRTNAAIGTLAFDIKGNNYSKGSTSTFKVQTSVNGVDYTDLATYTELGDTETKMFNLSSNVRYVKWIYVEKGATDGGNVAVGNITTETVNATITDADYATFVSTRNVSFAGTGVSAFAAKVNGNSVKLTELKKVPANTPVIIYKDVNAETTVVLPVSATAPAVSEENNDLRVSDGNVKNSVQFVIFALANKDKGIGFYKLGNDVTVPEGKCYISVATDNQQAPSAREFLSLGDDATGIKTVEGVTEHGVVYDLQGRRVAKPSRGLYIENGKKIMIK